MRFFVYPLMWAGGSVPLTPKEVLEDAGISCTWIPEEGNRAGAYRIDITPDKLVKLIEDDRIDIMISKKVMAFDFAGKRFKQR